VWRFCVVAPDRARATAPAALAEDLAGTEGVDGFSLVPFRN
jgi:putative Mg2+ transporter-C (MgtC) family protein